MKVIVIKVSGRRATALGENGEFFTIPAKKGMQTGTAFELPQPEKPLLSHTFVAAAAVFFVILFGGFAYSMLSVAGYVDVNINPGVRMAINPLGGVVALEGINEDGKALTKKMGTPFFGSAGNELKQIIEEAYQDSTLPSSGSLLITVSDDDSSRAEKTENELLQISFNAISAKNLSVAIATQKMSMAAFTILRNEQAKLSDAEKRSLYDSDRWLTAADKLYITKLEVSDKDQLQIVFSKTVPYMPGVQVVLRDSSGNIFPAQVIGASANSWTLQSGELREKQVYSVSVQGLPDTDALEASALYAGSTPIPQDSPKKDAAPATNDKSNVIPAPSASPSGSPDVTEPKKNGDANEDNKYGGNSKQDKEKGGNKEGKGDGNKPGKNGNDDNKPGKGNSDNGHSGKDDNAGDKNAKPKNNR